jgi:hypothetical protein
MVMPWDDWRGRSGVQRLHASRASRHSFAATEHLQEHFAQGTVFAEIEPFSLVKLRDLLDTAQLSAASASSARRWLRGRERLWLDLKGKGKQDGHYKQPAKECHVNRRFHSGCLHPGKSNPTTNRPC